MGVTSQAESLIRSLIAANRVGYRLPSERQMAATFGVGRTTIRLVLARLVSEGLVEARQGSGYFVLAKKRR